VRSGAQRREAGSHSAVCALRDHKLIDDSIADFAAFWKSQR